MASKGVGRWSRAVTIIATLALLVSCARSHHQNDGARDSLAATAKDTVTIRVSGPPRQHLIRDWQVDNLVRAGLQDPVPRLVRDLHSHPELIPFSGVLGGTMGFYDSTQIHVLNDHWVYAYFEDGHIDGYGLFEYSVTRDGKIRWKRVSAFLDD